MSITLNPTPSNPTSLHPEELRPVPLDADHVLRLAQPHEYEEFGNMLEDAFTHGCWVTEEYRRGLHAISARAETNYIWAVEQRSSGRIVAGVLTPHPEAIARGTSTFNILGVARAGRGRGIGHKLVEHAIDQARTNGAETISINSSPHMVHAHNLYYQHGFHRRIERETKVVDHGQRLYSFELRLAPPTSRFTSRRADTMPALSLTDPQASPDSVLSLGPSPITVALNPTDPDHLSIKILLRLTTAGEEFAVVDTKKDPARIHLTRADRTEADLAPKDVLDALAGAPTGGAPYTEASIRQDLIEAGRRLPRAANEEKEALARLIYARLGVLDYELRDPDAYVAGTEPTLVDIQLFSVLALFDQGIRREFGWGAASVRDYPYVWRYARKLAQRHGLLTQSEKQWIGLDGAGADGTNAAWDIPYRILEPLDREP